MEQYQTDLEKVLQLGCTYLQETTADGWELYESSDDCTVHTKLTEHSPISCLRASIVMKHNPEKVRDFCWNMKEADFKRFDSAMQKCADHEDNGTVRIRETITSLPWPIWARQLCFCMSKVTDKQGRIWIVQHSIPSHPKVPRQDDQYVRANLIIGAFCFEPHGDGGCLFHRLFLLDPAGDIPTFAVNASLGKMAAILKWTRSEMK